MHNLPIPAGMFRVALVRPLKGCDSVDPPMQPHGADEHYSLGGCGGWPLLWPKSQIRLAKHDQRLAAAPAKKTRPPVFVPATKRHQQLAAHMPSPPPEHVDAAPNRGDDQGDEIDGFLDTGANEGIYMPPLGDPASRGQQAGRPLSCTQRLRFRDGSQEKPPEAAATQANPTNVISPTTHHKAVDEQLKSAAPVPDKLQSTAPVEEKKKGRKHSRSKKAPYCIKLFSGAVAGEEEEDFCEESFRTHILYFVLSFALLYFYLHRFIKNPKKLESLVVVISLLLVHYVVS
jgi:hypothetical protein